MSIRKPFAPSGQTMAVSASTSAASAIVPGPGASLRVLNGTASIARLEWMAAAATDPTPGGAGGSLGVPANSVAVFDVGGDVKLSVSVLLVTGTGTVELTRGEGGY